MLTLNAPLILASARLSRAGVLASTGFTFTVEPADVDERAIEDQLLTKGADAITRACALSCAKAKVISARHPEALVIGADQLLICGEDQLHKPADLAEARAQLQGLRGRAHQLISGACLMQNSAPLWQGAETATLTMWAFDDAFIDAYLAAMGDAACRSVGCYALEHLGLHLFEQIEGRHDVILGLPMVRLLSALRAVSADSLEG